MAIVPKIRTLRITFWNIDTFSLDYLIGAGILGLGCFGPYTDFTLFIASWDMIELLPVDDRRVEALEFVSTCIETWICWKEQRFN